MSYAVVTLRKVAEWLTILSRDKKKKRESHFHGRMAKPDFISGSCCWFSPLMANRKVYVRRKWCWLNFCYIIYTYKCISADDMNARSTPSNYKSTHSTTFRYYIRCVCAVTCIEEGRAARLSGGGPLTFIDISSTQQRKRQSYLNRLHGACNQDSLLSLPRIFNFELIIRDEVIWETTNQSTLIGFVYLKRHSYRTFLMMMM
jgi:hypothetical protein